MDWTQQIELAAGRIKGHVQVTPVMTSDAVWDSPVDLKLEQTQHMGSFKTRGAFNTLIGSDVPSAGIVAASGGNHGAAVAYAARSLGYAARIFVPEIAGPAKIALIESAGADLTVVPGQYADAAAMAAEYEQKTGAMQVHPYDAQLTVAGQGTVLREWEDQGLTADTVLIAVGGGGLIAGALAWAQGHSARKIIAVEPETCNALDAALKAGEPVDVPISGVAANALGARRIGSICYDLAKASGTSVALVPDKAIEDAQSVLWRAHRQLVEPAGACALAALRCGAYLPSAGERVAVLVCGGNIAPDPLAN
ncbi:threonine/serine dehydratase [Thalassococcus lentus]|uniref:Threonine/serine dehydratase n=1 Tax=Thalassococcus lentus TaxID=1210524 RepID=A0ABT4XPJ8_9RHOB|nr:threonine/serine dehydratase [Thalassococcus lentus]MDA7423778.1 threonine/serine dehydratase [Thalassococcus lentus]